MAADTNDELLAGLRLHLAPLTPRQRARWSAGVVDPAVRAALASIRDADVHAELERARRCGARLVPRSDPHFPPLLREIPDPPHVLWVRGSMPRPDRLPVAIVGPRRPSPYGIAVARRIARDVVALGGVIVSGGARGVDAEAHLAALEAGVPTVAVLGCGVDVTYPRAHRGLFERIIASGAIVSELPCRSPPLKGHFPVRNRLLAGWARLTLVIEATMRSGSLITARLANDQGRDVLAVPGPVTSPTSEGTNDLIHHGAAVLRGVADIVAQLRDDEVEALGIRVPSAEPAKAGTGAPPDPVLDALPPGDPLDLDGLAESTGLAPGPLLARLTMLESVGAVEALAGGLWLRRRA